MEQEAGHTPDVPAVGTLVVEDQGAGPFHHLNHLIGVDGWGYGCQRMGIGLLTSGVRVVARVTPSPFSTRYGRGFVEQEAGHTPDVPAVGTLVVEDEGAGPFHHLNHLIRLTGGVRVLNGWGQGS